MIANARDISKGFDNVSSDVIPYFKNTVAEILEKYEPAEALARALALTTGYTKKIKERSLLLSAEGYITYMLVASYEIRSPGYFWNVLRRLLSPEIADSIKGMSMLASKMGVVFDLPQAHKSTFEGIKSGLEGEGFKVERPLELPEIFER